MKKLIAMISILFLTLLLNAETPREKLEKDILRAYMDMGFYDGSPGTRMDWMVDVSVSKEQPYNIYIYFRKNMPERRYFEAILLAITTTGKLTKKMKEKTFMVWFSVWDSDHKTFVPLATILTSNCRKFLIINNDKEKGEFLRECLILGMRKTNDHPHHPTDDQKDGR